MGAIWGQFGLRFEFEIEVRARNGIPAIRNLIREDKIAQMYSAIQTGAMHGMQTMDQCLKNLVNRGLITAQDAQAKAHDKAQFGPIM